MKAEEYMSGMALKKKSSSHVLCSVAANSKVLESFVEEPVFLNNPHCVTKQGSQA